MVLLSIGHSISDDTDFRSTETSDSCNIPHELKNSLETKQNASSSHVLDIDSEKQIGTKSIPVQEDESAWVDEDLDEELDETDDQLMLDLSELICSFVEEAFVGISHLHSKPIHKLPPQLLLQFVDLVGDNLGDFYSRLHGKNWKLEKVQEMRESGLIYVWCTSKSDLVGFILFKLCDNDSLRVLYLYEIQINAKFQNLQYGSKLLSGFHRLVSILKKCELKDEISHYLHNIYGTCLTVFPDNVVATKWYFKLGYDYSKSSPRPRNLRNGRVVLPDYFILQKSIT